MQTASRQSLAVLGERLEDRARSSEGDSGAEGLQRIGEGLFSVASLLDREVGLRRTLSDPAVSSEGKTHLVDGLLGSQLDDDTVELLREIVKAHWARPADLVDGVVRLAAQALFSLAESRDELDDVEDELFRFARIVDREPTLRSALTDESRSMDDRLQLLDQLLADRTRETTRTLLASVVRARRGRSLDEAVDELSRLAAAHRQRLIAQVRVAAPLDDDQAERLSASLRRLYGRAVRLQVEVDPEVLGGIVVRVGDEVVDGSVGRRLSEAHRRLAG
jgi:F-type H+-transporting ATPase subunit delta